MTTNVKDHQLVKAVSDLARKFQGAPTERTQDWYESMPLSAGNMFEWFETALDIHLYPLFLIGPTRVRVLSFYLGDDTNPVSLALALYRANVPPNAAVELSSFVPSQVDKSPADNRYTFAFGAGIITAPQVSGGSYDVILPKEEILRPEQRYFLAVQSYENTVRIPGAHPPQNAGFAETAFRRNAHSGFRANVRPASLGAWPSELYIVRGDVRSPIHFTMRSTEGVKLWGPGYAPSGL